MVDGDGTTFDSQAAVTLAIVFVTGLSLWFLGRKASEKSGGGGTGSIRVTELNVYPVKSCGETRPSRAVATARGFENDRIAQVVDSSGKYCTPRDRDKAKLFQIRPHVDSSPSSGHRILTLKAAPALIADGASPDTVEVDLDDETKSKPRVVEVLESGEHTLMDYGDEAAEWLARATGIPGCRLAGIGRDFERSVKVNPDQGDAVPTDKPAPLALNDEAPYLLTNSASLYDLNRRLLMRDKDAVGMRRFRPNIVVKGGLKPWEEDCIRRVRIGPVEFWAWQRCGRCTMTTVDRDTLERGPEPLNTLGTFRERAHGMRNFGMHLIPVEGGGVGGTISVGDEVEIVEYDEERRNEWKRNFE